MSAERAANMFMSWSTNYVGSIKFPLAMPNKHEWMLAHASLAAARMVVLGAQKEMCSL